jgi:hypothetical protein
MHRLWMDAAEREPLLMTSAGQSVNAHGNRIARLIEQHEGRSLRLEYLSPTQATLVVEDRINHATHFLFGVLTFGFWWIVWFYLAINSTGERFLVDLDMLGSRTLVRTDGTARARPAYRGAGRIPQRPGAPGLAAVAIAVAVLVATLSHVTCQRIQGPVRNEANDRSR